METQLPYWHPGADYSGTDFFIRKLRARDRSESSRIPFASIPQTSFLFLSGGELLAEIDGTPYLCAAGHLLLIPEGMPFVVHWFKEIAGYCGCFSSALSPEIARQALQIRRPVHQAFWFEDAVLADSLFGKMARTAGRPALQAQCLGLLLAMVDLSSGRTVNLVATAFLERLFDPEQSILQASEYAESMEISENYLNRCIKNGTGRSIRSWIEIARVGRARKLLEDPSVPIIDVAAGAGILDQSYFARMFRKATGLTPSAYRKKVLAGMHGKS